MKANFVKCFGQKAEKRDHQCFEEYFSINWEIKPNFKRLWAYG